jgi:tetratricopeptide (TPR) repeat protein
MSVLRLAALALALGSAFPALALPPGPPSSTAVQNSGLDAPLFYQLLIGEIELRQGDAGTAYQVMLDAARKTRDEPLFRRATEVALEAKAGDQALEAARAWRTAVPTSSEAHRYETQLLVAMNRLTEVPGPLAITLKLVPPAERASAISSLNNYFARTADRKAVVSVLEKVLVPYTAGTAPGGAEPPATAVAAWVTLGRARLEAEDLPRALEAAQRAAQLAPNAEPVALLAIDMMRTQPQAEALVQGYFGAQPPPAAVPRSAVRLGYARSLAMSQRFADAARELEAVTRDAPQFTDAWLTLGALYLELKRPADAEAALKDYLARADLDEASASAAAAPAAAEAATPAQRRAQAYLLLAQAAEQRRDFAAAEAWLLKVDSPQALMVQSRRASLLAQQGQMAQALDLIRRLPERGPDDVRAKLLAEAQLLRDQKDWAAALAVLVTANERFPKDTDLLYEQAMMAEKLGRFADMEQLLRRAMSLRPEHSAAYNALGYTLADRNERLPEAKQLIERALQLSPGDPFLIDSMGWVEYRLGNLDSALWLLGQAYRARPDTEIAVHLGEVLWVQGRRDEALKIWAEARARDAGNELLNSTLARLKVDL